jgi:carbon storage regulator
VLVLTRKLGEGIAIGDNIKIVVMQIKGKQVRLGIKADVSTSVHREEVYQRIQDENRDAGQSKLDSLDKAYEQMFSSKVPDEKTLNRVPFRRKVRSEKINDKDH